MAIPVNDNIKVNAPKPSDPRFFAPDNTPWASVEAVEAGIPLTERHPELRVDIMGVIYWWKNSAWVLESDDTKLAKGNFVGTAETLNTKIDSILANSTVVNGVTTSSSVPPTGNIHALGIGPGTYPNWGGMVIPANNIGTLQRVDGVYSVSLTEINLTIVDGLESISTTEAGSANNDRLLNLKIEDAYQVLGEPILKTYPKDLTTLLSTVTNASSGWINNTPITTKGTLKTLRIKGDIGAIIQPFVYEITGTSGSFVYTELHAFAPFTTTAIIHTQEINDAYVVGVGKFIGFKSNANIYYTSSGSGFTTLQPIIQTQTYGSDFVINENITVGLNQRVDAVEGQQVINDDAITGLQNIVGREDLLTPYSKDFTTITTEIAVNAIFINKKELTARGKLHSIRVKAPIGSIVTPYVYTVSGTSGSLSFVENHAYNPFVTTSETHTEPIVDDYVVEVGQLIGYKSPTGIFYKTGTSEISYAVGNVVADTHSFAYDFVINENTTFGLVGRVSALEENANIQKVILKPSILYKNNLSTLTDFQVVNWSISGGVAVPSAVGSANFLYLQKEYHVTPRQMSIDITLSSNAVFDIHCKTFFGYPNGTGYFSIDVPTNTLKIYNNTRTLITSGVIPFTLIAGRKYKVTLSIVDWLNVFEIKDTVNSDIFALEYQIETSALNLENRQNESYNFYLNSGSVTGVSLSNLIISSKKNPLIYLTGDSISEGAYFSTANYNRIFGLQLRNALKGNLVLSARGGSNYFDVEMKISNEAALIKPDYVMITIGTNGGNTQDRLSNIVTYINAIGAVAILNHIPNGNAFVDSEEVNATIDAVCASSGAIRGCLFDVATSINNDPTLGGNPALYDGDMIHPNALGHDEMFKRFQIDLPFLFL